MKIEDPAPAELPTTLFLVVSVVITVLVALFLAFSDELQTRLPVLVRPTIVVQSGSTATPTLPSPSATPSPAHTPGETGEPTSTPTATSISIVAEAVCENVPVGWQPVVVGPSDTLYTLSIRYGATVGEIVQANCLETGTVLSGLTVYLPPTPPTRIPCGPPQWWRSYVVRPGDTLYGLAVRHGTTVYAIMQANCLVESKIFAGRSLYLPPIPATVPPPPPTVVIPSATPTLTPSATSTGLPSPTPSATVGGTASPTTTAAPPSTPTITATPPASATATPSPTATVNPTATMTPTSEPSATAVPSVTPTVSPTDTPQPTQAPTNTPQPTATNPPPTDTPQAMQSP